MSEIADGTVVRWLGSGKYNYAAIKAPGGWYTTAQKPNRYVKQVYPSLRALLTHIEDDATNIEMSTDNWKPRTKKENR